MKQKWNVFYVVVIVALVVLPTAVMLTWHGVTQNPNLRPLAVTEQSLRAYDRARPAGTAVRIVAEVECAENPPGGPSKAALDRVITRAFKTKGMDVSVLFLDGGTQTRITYVVGYSRIGPFSSGRASDGVSAAVQAFHMYEARM